MDCHVITRRVVRLMAIGGLVGAFFSQEVQIASAMSARSRQSARHASMEPALPKTNADVKRGAFGLDALFRRRAPTTSATLSCEYQYPFLDVKITNIGNTTIRFDGDLALGFSIVRYDFAGNRLDVLDGASIRHNDGDEVDWSSRLVRLRAGENYSRRIDIRKPIPWWVSPSVFVRSGPIDPATGTPMIVDRMYCYEQWCHPSKAEKTVKIEVRWQRGVTQDLLREKYLPNDFFSPPVDLMSEVIDEATSSVANRARRRGK